jgi:hypothetical protein
MSKPRWCRTLLQGRMKHPNRGQVREPDPRPEGGAVSVWFYVLAIQHLHNSTRSASFKGDRFENPTPALTRFGDQDRIGGLTSQDLIEGLISLAGIAGTNVPG